MRIGLSFDLKPKDAPPAGGAPEDFFEEFDSEETVAAIAAAIGSCGHDVVRLGGGREFLEGVLREEVDFVFNIAEGRGTHRSREGQVPSVLEMLGIPYSFSDPLTLSISLDKPLTKRLVSDSGVSVPREWLAADEAALSGLTKRDLPYPLFVKPAYEGSSKGIRRASRIDGPQALAERAGEMLRAYGQPVLVEEFVAGEECTVGVLGNSPPEAIGAVRVRPKAGPDPDFVYGLEVKRDWERQLVYETPAPLDPPVTERLLSDAVRAFRAIGCRDVARVDFRVRGGVPVFLEINPLPGLSPAHGDLPLLARGMGIGYEDLMRRMLAAAFSRCGLT